MMYRRIRNCLEHMEENIIKSESFRKDFSFMVNDKIMLKGYEITIDLIDIEKMISLFEQITREVKTEINNYSIKF